jgi:hypothetical protein
MWEYMYHTHVLPHIKPAAHSYFAAGSFCVSRMAIATNALASALFPVDEMVAFSIYYVDVCPDDDVATKFAV